MSSPGPVWVVAAGSALLFGYLIAFGTSGGAVMLMALLAALMFSGLAWATQTPADSSWIFKWVIVGFLVKIAGTWARHYTVTVIYGGGDSFRYYRVATELANVWRAGEVPGLTGTGSFGTQVTEAVTGAMFAVFTPDLLGGFMMFSILAFAGQMMIYSGFRHWAKPHQLKPYAFFIFFLPTYTFWPSSIGKDALVLFALGGAFYFTARVLKAFELRYIIGLALFLVALGLIRIHIAGLIVAGLVGAGILAKLPEGTARSAQLRRLVFIGVCMVAGAIVVARFPEILGVDLTGEDSIDAFTQDVTRRTSEDGTVASGEPVSAIGDVPEAIALVLFRPFIWESREIQHFFAAMETTLIAGLTIWFMPSVLRNLRQGRRNGLVVFSTVYTMAFAVAFSIVRNLGIIARQRGQVLAMFLAIIVILGWEERDPERGIHPAFRDEADSSPPEADSPASGRLETVP